MSVDSSIYKLPTCHPNRVASREAKKREPPLEQSSPPAPCAPRLNSRGAELAAAAAYSLVVVAARRAAPCAAISLLRRRHSLLHGTQWAKNHIAFLSNVKDERLSKHSFHIKKYFIHSVTLITKSKF